jgi:glycine cleavage system H protein
MNIPADLKYSDNDEWVRIEGNTGTIGITDYAQDQLSDVVFVEVIVEPDETLDQGDACATVESVKAAADVYLPVGGTVTATNEEVLDTPELVNTDPYGAAWMVKIELSDPSQLDGLLTAEAYQKHCEDRQT